MSDVSSQSNQDVVIFLGAGASKNSGAPLMTDFLDKAEDIFRLQLASSAMEHFERVLSGWTLLRQVEGSVSIDMHNIEHVFGAFEMARIVGRLGECEDYVEIERIYQSMRYVIFETIRITQQFPCVKGTITAPLEYDMLSDCVHQFVRQPKSRVPRSQLDVPTIITTNYDCALDISLESLGLGIEYGFREPDLAPGHIPLLKLHGSMNWFLCPGCQHFNLMMINRAIHQSHPASSESGTTVSFKRMTGICANCEEFRKIDAFTEPFLVPPTWKKGDSGQLAKVWRKAAHALSRARYILFIGYSFPETDDYMRYLLALGLSGGPRIRNIVNLNPDDGQSTVRLKNMLAPSLTSKIHHVAQGFDEKVQPILDEFFQSTLPRIN